MIHRSKKVIRHGITFDSTFEADLFDALKKMGVDFDFQVQFFLTGKTFPKNTKKPLLSSGCAEAVTMKVDFVIRTETGLIYADAKGFTTDMARMRYRLLKHQLAEKGEFDSQIKFIYQSKEGKTLLKLAALNQKELFLETLFSTANF